MMVLAGAHPFFFVTAHFDLSIQEQADEKPQASRTATNDHNPERDENLHQVEHQ